MSHQIRNVAAALVTAVALVSAATPALAFQDEGLATTERHTPIVLDALVLRPLGLVMFATSFLVAVIPTAIVAVTRPSDIPKSLKYWIATPFRYTFVDPLGQHPPVGMLEN